MTRKVSITELSHHAHDTDGWIALNGVVWDMSNFAATHPGGPEVIQSHLGKDGSELYNEIHSPGLVAAHLGADKRIGTCEGSEGVQPPKQKQTPSIPKPDLSSIVSVAQFQDVAETVLSDRAWGYVFGATEDGHTNRENVDFFRRIMFRPRVLPGSSETDTSTTLLGRKYALPFFSAPTSSVRVSHPDGEVAIAKASVAYGVPAIVPTMSSYAMSEIVDAMPPQYPFLFQLYVNSDRAKTEQCLDEARRMGARAVLVTVDLPVLSKRQVSRARRGGPSAPQDSEETEQEDKPAPTGAGALAPPPTNMAIKEDLSWDDIKWIQTASQLPIFLKGIQTAQDAKRAYEIGCAGIVLSNHGGRAVDTAPPAILTLLEIHAVCPEILSQMEIILDGGIRRGSDILKAVCLGANAVCLGRPFLYALSYGEEGVHHAFNILTEELKIAMTLIGITSLDEAHPGLLNTGDIDHLIYTRDKYPLATANILRKKGHKL